MDDDSSMFVYVEAYYALDDNIRKYIKGLKEVENFVESDMSYNDNEDETGSNDGKYDMTDK